MPEAPWLSLLVDERLPSLAPGESTSVSLLLTPPADMALTEYNGQIQFAAAQDWLSVPFTFRAVSNATGTLTVTAFDEHFFYTAEAPKLSGATVRVVDSISREEVAVLTTDANGAATATALREGYYDMEVRADKHDTYRATIFLSSGITNTVRAYLPTQAITYTWTVVPIEIEEALRNHDQHCVRDQRAVADRDTLSLNHRPGPAQGGRRQDAGRRNPQERRPCQGGGHRTPLR